MNGWPDSCKDLDQELKLYWIHHFNLSIVDGILLLGEDCIVVPAALHDNFLKALHYTHQRITKTLARARNHVYWPGIAHDVLQLCHECEICAEDQDSSMVQMLAKLRVTLTWSSLITIHLLCLNIHYHCWQCLQLLLLSRPFLVIQGYQ